MYSVLPACFKAVATVAILKRSVITSFFASYTIEAIQNLRIAKNMVLNIYLLNFLTIRFLIRFLFFFINLWWWWELRVRLVLLFYIFRLFNDNWWANRVVCLCTSLKSISKVNLNPFFMLLYSERSWPTEWFEYI